MRNSIDALRSSLLGQGPDGILSDLGILVLRLGFGLTMALTHGWGTLSGFLENPAEFPDPLGLGPELSMGLMAVAEFGCALSVAIGLLTRFTLVPLLVGMGTAFFVFHAGDPFGRKELAFLYFLVWVALMVTGPGRYSLDRVLFGRERRARKAAAAVLVGALLLTPVARAESWVEGDLPRQGDRPLEAIPGLDSVFGVLETEDGVRLRTITTRLEGAESPLPAILFVQWLSCDSIELPGGRESGWSRMLRRVAAESGRVMLRTGKASVGGSEGPPWLQLGYERELSRHRDWFAWLLRHPLVDPERIVIFGASMEVTMGPLGAEGRDVQGVVIRGGGAKTWLDSLSR